MAIPGLSLRSPVGRAIFGPRTCVQEAVVLNLELQSDDDEALDGLGVPGDGHCLACGRADNDAVSKAMFDQAGGKYKPPACSADKGKQFNVSSGYTYLKSAIESKNDPKPLLASANRVITEAIVTDGQDKSVSAWYGLGWVDLFQGDVAGADTALARAEKLGPDCKAEIDRLRRIAYAPIANSGVSALQDWRHHGGAQVPAARRTSCGPTAAFPPYYIGVIYADRGQNDSALAYFAKVAAGTSTDSNDVKLREPGALRQAATADQQRQGGRGGSDAGAVRQGQSRTTRTRRRRWRARTAPPARRRRRRRSTPRPGPRRRQVPRRTPT